MLAGIVRFFKSIGPGFIIASAVLGPGSVAIASRVGSEHGYALLWVVALSTICMATFASMATRFAVAQKASILQAIADNYGRWFAMIIGISSFLVAASFQFGNNLGIATAMEELTGVGSHVWPLIFTPIAMILVFWGKRVYQILERLMITMVLIMIVAFVSNLLFVRPDWVGVFHGFVPSSYAALQFGDIAAIVATTFSLVGCLYQAYLVHDRGWKRSELNTGLRDTVMGIVVLGCISALIIITAAAALFPQGISVSTAGDMALQLEALFGPFSKHIFSIGLCAAAFSSLLVNAVIGGGLLSDGLGYGRSIQDKVPRFFSALILLLGMLVAVFFKGDVVYALVLASASSLFAIPAVAVGLLMVVNNEKVMGDLVNNRRQNSVGVLGMVLTITLVAYMYYRLVTFIGQL